MDPNNLTPAQRQRLHDLVFGDEVCEVDEVMSSPTRPLPPELEDRLVQAALDAIPEEG